MTPARWEQIQEVLNDAMAMPAIERGRFVALACGGDRELRHEIDSLLAQASAASDFLSTAFLQPSLSTCRQETMLVGKQLGPYLVKSHVGGGGMGDVFLAEDTRLHRLVALKALHEGSATTPEGRDRLLGEARAAAALNHPHIAAIYDVLDTPDDPAGPPYIVMEYVEGDTLSDRLRTGALPLADALRIGKDIASALAAAHGRGIIHRDLKPANLRLTSEGRVKVLDFGLARKIQATPDATTETIGRTFQTHTPQPIAGTPGYMSPEQSLGRVPAPASDIFSLGVVLFQMLTGRRPFGGDDFLSAALSMIASPVPHVVDFVSNVPAAVDALLTRMLSKEPGDRPPADEIVAILDDAFRLVAIPAPEPAALTVGRRRVRRLVITSFAGVALVVGVVTVSDPMRRQFGIRFGGSAVPITLAIMPVDAPVGGNATAEYLGAGITNLIAANFGSVPHLTVQSRAATSVYEKDNDAFVALSRALGATHVLKLSWRSVEPLRLQARVFRPGEPQPEWEETLQGDATAIEAALLDRLARVLERRTTGRRFASDEWNRLHKMPTRSGAALAAQAEARALLDRRDRPAADIDRAIGLLQDATRLDPQFVYAWATLGDAWWAKYLVTSDASSAAQAIASLRRAIAIDPESAAVHHAFGDMQLRTGDSTGAEASFRQALRLQPDYDLSQRALARVLSTSGRVDEAEAIMRQAIGFSKNWNNFFVLGTIDYRAGRYTAAADAFSKAVEVAPQNAAAFTMLGNTRYILGDAEQAVGNFQHAVRLGPTRAAYANLALAYYDAGRFDDALHSYEKALVVDPRSAVTHRNIGDVHRRLGHEQTARAEYERAIALANESMSVNSRDASTIALIALCEAKLGRRVAAELHAAEAVAIDSTNFEPWQRSAEVHALLNDSDSALRDLAIAVARGFDPRMARRDDELGSLVNNKRFDDILKRSSRNAVNSLGGRQ